MPSIESQIDANFYNLAYQLLGSREEDKDEERREHRRQPFDATRRVTPCREPGVPEWSRTLAVQCCDLTQSGFSFLLPNRPDFTSLIVAFDDRPGGVHLAAKVTHCSDVMVHASGVIEPVREAARRGGQRAADAQGGTFMVLVGCRFTQRIRHLGGKAEAEASQGDRR